MTVTFEDPLCPHGQPIDRACDACLAEMVEPWKYPFGYQANPPQIDTPVPDPREEP